MELNNFFNQKYSRQFFVTLAVLLCFIYGYLGYFFVRSEFFFLIALCSLAFLATYAIIEKSKFTFSQLVFLAIIYRLVLIFVTPNLSQDFYRFYWDGQLILNGINPYIQNVNYYFINGLQDQIYNAEALRDGMGGLNASNYSNYPPVSQFLYAISAWFAQDSLLNFVIALRVLLISFDLLFIYAARKILIHFNLNPKKLFWYSLNPLCILEITGNLHLEGVMIALFILGFYFLLRKNLLQSAALIALSIGTKLLSVIALPLIFKHLLIRPITLKSLRKVLIFGLGILGMLCLQFAFFFNPVFIDNFSQTIGLWFGKFEFNASVFYLVRWLGYQVYGYNIIQTYGWVMPIISILAFSIILFWKKTTERQVLTKFLWMLTIYFMLSTTVHPWYILFPLALSVFTKYKFAYIWSFLVLLSYKAYIEKEVAESMGAIAIEYTMVVLFIVNDLFGKRLKSYFEVFSIKK